MNQVAVESCKEHEAPTAFETTNLQSELSIVANKKGEPELSTRAYQLLGPGQGIPFTWDRFRTPKPAGTWDWVRHFWQRGGVLTQLGGQQIYPHQSLKAGWELIGDLSGGQHYFYAIFQNGPITRRHATARIFMSLYDVSGSRPRFVAFQSRDALRQNQFLPMYIPYLPTSRYRLRVGALSWLNVGAANAYAEVITDDIKVHHYGPPLQMSSAQAASEDADDELALERLLEDSDDMIVRAISDDEKASGDWVEMAEEG